MTMTKSKKYYIRLMAKHDGLSYYCNCVFGFVKWRCCIVVFWWLRTMYNMDSLGFTLRGNHNVFKHAFVAVQSIVETGMFLIPRHVG
jgi:hypothetical protein